ncbi:MAG: hypothetical protein WCF23_02550 [Candidatus Nitrosopolaris sp.]
MVGCPYEPSFCNQQGYDYTGRDRIERDIATQIERIDLANDLDKADREGNWYWIVKHLINYSLHGPLLSADDSELTPSSRMVYMEVIPYFDQTLVQLREFIENIKMRDPIFQ